MATATELDLDKYCADVASRAKRASARLATRQREREGSTGCGGRPSCCASNVDADRARPTHAIWPRRPATASPTRQIDRLRLTPKRIEEIAAGLEQVAALPDPIGEVIDSTIRPNGLRIDKVRVPLGVVFFIYESRPNVTADAAAICVKSGNAVILRGGKEAMHSSQAIVDLLARGGRRSRACRPTPCNW